MNTFALAVITASDKPFDPNDVKPGWVALGIVLLMCLATALLLVSFIKHTRKAREPWESEKRDTPAP